MNSSASNDHRRPQNADWKMRRRTVRRSWTAAERRHRQRLAADSVQQLGQICATLAETAVRA